MRELYIECNMGIAGDMLMSALSELVPDSDGFVKRLNKAGIPGVKAVKEKSAKCSITGTHIRVFVNGEEESEEMHHHHHHHDHEHHHDHHHEYGHDHHHHEHHHSSLGDISALIDSLKVSEWVKENAKAVYRIIAEGEGYVHGKEITDIHFHEVGTADAVADIVGCCMLMEKIGADKITASPVRTGFGRVRCAHGYLPIPAPATAYILKGLPQYAGNIEGELCTPTGAALLKHFAGDFGRMPLMRVEKTGYGMGSKDFPVANCVRVFLSEGGADYKTDNVLELVCNIDDMTGEDLAFACERIFEAGALDVCTIPCGMKKSRPGIILLCICKEEKRESIVNAVFKHTSTIGLRVKPCERYVLERREETAETELGFVRVKISETGDIKKVKAEFDDIEKIARDNNISLSEVRKKI
ncbi:MAG: nickel pincer cofactor biosynthesis protein LarC [Eubacterium sp.]|nr:nickel pincer cofactor biosynthesis protein LarC [Eubacterium sp.]